MSSYIVITTHEQLDRARVMIGDPDLGRRIHVFSRPPDMKIEAWIDHASDLMGSVAYRWHIRTIYMTSGARKEIEETMHLNKSQRLQLWHAAVDITEDRTSIEVATFDAIMSRLGYER